jgi:hypothetical protein
MAVRRAFRLRWFCACRQCFEREASADALMGNGVVIVYYDGGSRTGAPACATVNERFAVDGTTAGGKIQVAGLLTAYTGGKTVHLWGNGTCTAYGDTETINYLNTVE